MRRPFDSALGAFTEDREPGHTGLNPRFPAASLVGSTDCDPRAFELQRIEQSGQVHG
jgi:hypothetical protein